VGSGSGSGFVRKADFDLGLMIGQREVRPTTDVYIVRAEQCVAQADKSVGPRSTQKKSRTGIRDHPLVRRTARRNRWDRVAFAEDCLEPAMPGRTTHPTVDYRPAPTASPGRVLGTTNSLSRAANQAAPAAPANSLPADTSSHRPPQNQTRFRPTTQLGHAATPVAKGLWPLPPPPWCGNMTRRTPRRVPCPVLKLEKSDPSVVGANPSRTRMIS